MNLVDINLIIGILKIKIVQYFLIKFFKKNPMLFEALKLIFKMLNCLILIF